MTIKVVYGLSYGLRLSEMARALLNGMGITDPYALPRHDPRLVRAAELFPAEDVGVATLRGNRYRLTADAFGDESVEEPDDIKWVEVECTCGTCPVHDNNPVEGDRDWVNDPTDHYVCNSDFCDGSCECHDDTHRARR